MTESRTHVELVVIDLQAGDNAQVIFESLNYGGRELTAIDLTKNHVFFQATKLGLDLHEIHRQQWAPFDEDWWRKRVVQSRLHRVRAELLLMHWLKLEKLEEVRAYRLFVGNDGLNWPHRDGADSSRRRNANARWRSECGTGDGRRQAGCRLRSSNATGS